MTVAVHVTLEISLDVIDVVETISVEEIEECVELAVVEVESDELVEELVQGLLLVELIDVVVGEEGVCDSMSEVEELVAALLEVAVIGDIDEISSIVVIVETVKVVGGISLILEVVMTLEPPQSLEIVNYKSQNRCTYPYAGRAIPTSGQENRLPSCPGCLTQQ